MASGGKSGTVEFGPHKSMVGSITAPKKGTPEIGVILFGLGVAELMAARQLSRLGCVAMQIRVLKDPAEYNNFDKLNATYAAEGISLCTAAMDLLSEEWNVRTFILMGNCAAANVSFNSALRDPRVCGLILTNPLISATVMADILYKQNLFKADSWKRLLTGKSAVLGRLGGFLLAKLRGTARKSESSGSGSGSDMALPHDFDRKLEQLVTDRRVHSLIVFAHTEPGLEYFKKHYGKTFDRLVAAQKLWFEVLKRDVHIFSKDDDSARLLNETISKWTERVFFSPSRLAAAMPFAPSGATVNVAPIVQEPTLS